MLLASCQVSSGKHSDLCNDIKIDYEIESQDYIIPKDKGEAIPW